MTGVFVFLLAGLSVCSFSGNPVPRDKILRDLFTDPLFLALSVALWISLTLRAWNALFLERPRRPATCVIAFGVVLLLSGLSLSLTCRTEEEIIAAQGEVTPMGRVVSMESDIPEKILVTGREKVAGMTKASVEIVEGGRRHRVHIFPFSVIKGRLVHIADAGLSPRIVVEKGKDVLKINYLQLLPPGKKAAGGEPEALSFEVSLSPERKLQKGRLTAAEYNLGSPSYRVLIKEGSGRTFFERVIKAEGIYREGDLTLTLKGTTRWVKMRNVSDPFLIFICLGIVCILSGALLYPFQVYKVFVKNRYLRERSTRTR